MTISIYVDGAGGDNPGFGYYVKESGESFYEKKSGITNNQAEYLAIIEVLTKTNINVTINANSGDISTYI